MDGGAWPQGPIRIQAAVFQTRNGSRPLWPPPAVIDHGPSDGADVVDTIERGKTFEPLAATSLA